ncbi:SOS response-associated peptidase family protein [Mesorhizobium koreense]|uniref:SOS response-associated peptidase family protein n=1 Tax=Mesorhizobium koreense TaxID=3074855 RepID=UPI00287B9E02|nr:SOS response-associated peptidase family protein [Mesorhizobium sp. WR6]
MSASVFNSEASIRQRRVVIRRNDGDIEMVELSWGLQTREPGGCAFTVVRAEGRTFPDHRCLVPTSEFRHRNRSKHYGFSLADGDWFYFAGVWRPATRDWPEAYAILTTEASADVAPFHDRQMAVVRREQRMAWLDRTCREDELLRPLPADSFKVARLRSEPRQAELTF